MQIVTKHANFEPLRITEEKRADFGKWLNSEIEDAISARDPQERLWRECLRQYEGIPRQRIRNTPIENAPNIEVTLGAIAADTIYAQAMDLIFSISPVITVRAKRGKLATGAAKGLQVFVNHVAAEEADLKKAAQESLLDDVKLGTGAYYSPWIEWTKKTKVSTVKWAGPKVYALPLEDVIVPGGAYSDIQAAPWLSTRFWYTKGELVIQSRRARPKWRWSEAQPAGHRDEMRKARERAGKTDAAQREKDLYEIHYIYCHYDIDGDGIEEDLLAVWDRTSKRVLAISYNPYDRRPVEVMRYQLRGHLFYGLGVVEMLSPYQDEATELHNQRTLNAIISNTKIFRYNPGSGIIPKTVYPAMWLAGNKDDFEAVDLGEVNPSIVQAEALTISMAERRVGASDLQQPRPSQILSSRTPGITALSAMQAANRRFAPAFDDMRLATAGAVRQCLWRYQEQLLAGNREVESHIRRVLGDEAGRMVIEVMRRDDFDDAVEIELTASSSSINKDADKQNALLLINVLSSYYERTLTLMEVASNPQVAPPVQETARQIAEKAGEIIDRTLRTFDQIRDPESLILDLSSALDSQVSADQNTLGALNAIMAQLSQMGGGEQAALGAFTG